LDSFQPHEVVELLLFYAIPRRNTNELAHALMAYFGSLSRIFNAPMEDLMAVPGIGQNAAVFLSMLPKVWRLYRQDSSRTASALDTYQRAGEYAVDLFIGRAREGLALLTLDASCRLLRDHMLHEGTVNEVTVHPRLIVETVLRDNASQVLLAHNHPGGSLKPSNADLLFTRRVALALAPIDVDVADHLIVCDDRFFSLAHAGHMEKIYKEVAVRLLAEKAPYQAHEEYPLPMLGQHKVRYRTQ
ncbi:MAG: DNA repair protein RadC, partial [Eubacteriales bacterium]|nr:DNA repair protein RadC [Eubacteriales bacterium]